MAHKITVALFKYITHVYVYILESKKKGKVANNDAERAPRHPTHPSTKTNPTITVIRGFIEIDFKICNDL